MENENPKDILKKVKLTLSQIQHSIENNLDYTLLTKNVNKKRISEEMRKNHFLRYSSISAALVSGFAFGITFSITPFSSMTKVERTVPKETLP